MAGILKPTGRIRSKPVDAARVPAERIVPQGIPTTGVALCLHGGSFTSGSIASHRTLARNVAIALRARALLIGCRLASEHPFPAGLEDAAVVYAWILSHGIGTDRVVVCLSPNPDLTTSGEPWASIARSDVFKRFSVRPSGPPASFRRVSASLRTDLPGSPETSPP